MLQAIESIAQENLDIIQFIREDNTYYCFIETDINSKNFFRIFIDGAKRMGNYDKKNYGVEMKPVDESKAKALVFQGNLEIIVAEFKKWVKIIRDMHDTPSVHDENFAKHYSEFYFNEFKIVDNDADTSPFNPDQQDLIEAYLDYLSKAIVTTSESVDDVTKAELVSEIEEIKKALPITTKTKVMKGITKVFGKLYKVSKSFAKDVVTEAKKHLIKKLIEFGIEYGPKILGAFAKHQDKV
jgi:hypothetical protein